MLILEDQSTRQKIGANGRKFIETYMNREGVAEKYEGLFLMDKHEVKSVTIIYYFIIKISYFTYYLLSLFDYSLLLS